MLDEPAAAGARDLRDMRGAAPLRLHQTLQSRAQNEGIPQGRQPMAELAALALFCVLLVVCLVYDNREHHDIWHD